MVERSGVSNAVAVAYADGVWDQHMKKLYLGGASYRTIADVLNRKKVRTVLGERWHPTSVARTVVRNRGEKPQPALTCEAQGKLLERAIQGSRHTRHQLGVPEKPAEDEAEAYRLVAWALAGDREARQKLKDLLGFEDPAEEREAEMRTRLLETKNHVNEGHFDEVDNLLREAEEFGSCYVVQAHGIAAQRDRMKGDLPGARRHLEEARELAEECPSGACRADVLRREANLLLTAGQHEEGLSRADAAIQAYEELGHPGHDIDGAGLESSIRIRAARWPSRSVEPKPNRRRSSICAR